MTKFICRKGSVNCLSLLNTALPFLLSVNVKVGFFAYVGSSSHASLRVPRILAAPFLSSSTYRIRFAEFRCVTAPHVFQHDSQSGEILNCFGDLSGSLLRIVLSGSLLRKFLDNF
jgi:hypothetical protein